MAIASVAASRVHVDPNLLALLPDDDPAVASLRELHAQHGGMGLVTIAARGDDPAELERFLDATTAALGQLEQVTFSIHEVEPELATRIGLLQLAAADVRELTTRLKGALALGPALNPIVTQRLMDLGPVSERIGRASEAGPMLGGGEGRGRILVKPSGSAHDQEFSIALMDELQRIVDAQLAANPGVEVEWIGGAYRHSVEDRRGIEQDLVWTSVASFVLVLGVVAIGFRSVKATVLLMVPLAASSVLGVAAAWLLYDSLNTYTSFGTAILFGLGIDFGIHLISRYRELRSEGHGRDEAMELAWDRSGPPCTTAALTTAAGFLALAAASFHGFSQLGILLAIGLVVSLVAMLVGLPILLPWLDPAGRADLARIHTRRPSQSTYRLAPIGLMVAVLVTGVIGAIKLPQLEWEFDLSVLRRGGLAYAELDETERALAADSYSPVVVTFPTRQALADAQRRVEEGIRSDAYHHIGRVVSTESVLPVDQADRLAALTDLQQQLHDPDLRYLPPPLVTKLLPLRDAELAFVDRAELPASVLELVGGSDGAHRLLVFPKGNMWDIREASAFAEEIGATFPNRAVAGEYLALGSLYRTLMRDTPLVATLAFLLVAALTAIDLRRPTRIAAALGTLVAGLVWGGAAIEAVGVHLSMINIVGLPILLGISVDVVIHLLHRLAEEGPGGVRRALSTTGVAVSMSAMTTILGFASLILAGNRGVQSLGLLVSIGLTVVSVASVIVLPLAWAAGWRITGRAPGADRRRFWPTRAVSRELGAEARHGSPPPQ